MVEAVRKGLKGKTDSSKPKAKKTSAKTPKRSSSMTQRPTKNYPYQFCDNAKLIKAKETTNALVLADPVCNFLLQNAE